MDYEFRRNSFDGTFHAEFSMGHEALGRWLLDELGTDLEKIEALKARVAEVGTSHQEWLSPGKVFHLTVTREEALIQANVVMVDSESQDNSQRDYNDKDDGDNYNDNADLSHYDEESVSLCGLEDFAMVLDAWADFIRRYGKR